ncbi:hypothetical protein PF004_g16593 [Phytophthora fragariae]|uniref:RxLR effector protein n=1 Tax=Phytophthora fragariae TaxID=53985 RepID=A0A6A3JMM0_9STRA|nr:hypothetical protein PF003_g6589 [Phytophthora fragariae]KAE8994688.1 hypothetical protein PF011_g16629 [Phytophthora fragariae]KAE9209014.1 hypothetical protein PF004_g16593 [Phytophthora fragariae]
MTILPCLLSVIVTFTGAAEPARSAMARRALHWCRCAGAWAPPSQRGPLWHAAPFIGVDVQAHGRRRATAVRRGPSRPSLVSMCSVAGDVADR